MNPIEFFPESTDFEPRFTGPSKRNAVQMEETRSEHEVNHHAMICPGLVSAASMTSSIMMVENSEIEL